VGESLEVLGEGREAVAETPGEALEPVKPWTVKGIAPEERNAAIAASERAGMTIGQWLTRAIRTQVQADRESYNQESHVPVVVGNGLLREADTDRIGTDRRSDLEDLERMIALARQIAEANKSPIPRSITRATHSVMRGYLKTIAGRTG